MVLGRNGSDYSAAVLAACYAPIVARFGRTLTGSIPATRSGARCEVVEVDVLPGSDGAFYFGAKVLHPRTITPIAQFQTLA